jgi:hypothetical protein
MERENPIRGASQSLWPRAFSQHVLDELVQSGVSNSSTRPASFEHGVAKLHNV